HRRMRRPRLREHPQRPLTHLRRILPVHRVPSLLEERNESQADSDHIDYLDDTGFAAAGDLIDGILAHVSGTENRDDDAIVHRELRAQRH
ncbi:Atu4866 domain-containing protein, partial [Microbacterium paludicola]|uniref:Atu4866 domain-containing protein n=1 Tax=Microbacterium paludicola TaxID=300019 RepID=UPI0031DB8E55